MRSNTAQDMAKKSQTTLGTEGPQKTDFKRQGVTEDGGEQTIFWREDLPVFVGNRTRACVTQRYTVDKVARPSKGNTSTTQIVRASWGRQRSRANWLSNKMGKSIYGLGKVVQKQLEGSGEILLNEKSSRFEQSQASKVVGMGGGVGGGGVLLSGIC